MHKIYEEEKDYIRLIKNNLKNIPEHKFKSQIFRKYYYDILNKADELILKYPEFERSIYLIKSIIFNIPVGDYTCDNCKKLLNFSQVKTLLHRNNKNHLCSEQCRIEFFNKNPDIKFNAQEKKRKTCLEKYGVDHSSKDNKTKKKTYASILKFWNNKGISNAFQDTDVKNKIRKTCLEKYGTKFAIQNENIKNKAIKTIMNRFGVNNSFKSEEVKNKIRKTCLEKYGVSNYVQTKEFRDKYCNTSIKNYGVKFPAQSNIIKKKLYEARKRNGTLNRSHMEIELFKRIKNIITEAEPNNRLIIDPFELDIIIPSKKIGIEFNGRHWHKNDMDSNFKRKLCENINWKLYVVKEDDWRIDKESEINKCLMYINNTP